MSTKPYEPKTPDKNKESIEWKKFVIVFLILIFSGLFTYYWKPDLFPFRSVSSKQKNPPSVDTSSRYESSSTNHSMGGIDTNKHKKTGVIESSKDSSTLVYMSLEKELNQLIDGNITSKDRENLANNIITKYTPQKNEIPVLITDVDKDFTEKSNFIAFLTRIQTTAVLIDKIKVVKDSTKFLQDKTLEQLMIQEIHK